MAIQYPRVLKNMNLFVDGRGYAGRVDDVTLPKLTLKTEEHRGGGMDLPVDLDMGMERLEATMTVPDFSADLFRSFGLLDSQGIPMTVRGAIQAQGDAQATPVVVNLRGGWKEIDPGTWKPGDKNALSLTATLSYMKLSIGGEELIEIDAVNMIRRINGADQLSGQREALGL